LLHCRQNSHQMDLPIISTETANPKSAIKSNRHF
jgi:hypothetical protein